MRTTIVSALGVALAATAAGCAHESARPGATMMQAGTMTCPLAQLYDVTATITEIRSGVAVTFVAPEEEREKLREVVRDMASPKEGGAVDAFAGCPCATPGARTTRATPAATAIQEPAGPRSPAQPSGGSASMQAKPLVFDTLAREDDTATGAVLLLRTRSSDETTALSTALRDKLQALREGCRP